MLSNLQKHQYKTYIVDILGSQHVLDNIELLPGGKVLGQGAASRLGIVIQRLHFASFFLGIVLIFIILLGIPALLSTENPDYQPEVQEETSHNQNPEVPNNKQSDLSTAIQQQNSKLEQPKTRLNTERLAIWSPSILIKWCQSLLLTAC